MSDALCFLKTFRQNAGQATHGLDQVLVVVHEAAHQVLGVVCLPAPLCAHGILVVAPAEHALVCACQGGRGFHALVRRDAVKCMLIATPSTAHLILGPST